MRSRRLGGSVVAALLLSSTALAQDAMPPQTDANVKVTTVTLATGGLAHVEGEMTAAGETMRLAIERPQVADVLRTLVVTGPAPVVSIDLPAAEPVGERSETGRLLAGDLADPATVLESLVGEPVELSGGPHSVAGRLLAFSVVTIPGTDEIPSRPGVRVAVTGENGRVSYATFPSLDSLAIGGPAVEERMRRLVPALGESVDDGRRELSVRLAEAAAAGFSFVVPTTVWRPSYRALVNADGTVSLQGWATLENTTGLDWEDISLRLAVGTPVAYRQDVYSPLRTSRPEAPFEVGRTVETGIVAGEFEEAGDVMPAPMAALAGPGARYARRAPAAAAPAEVVTGGPAEAGSAVTIFPVAGAIDLAAGRTLTVPFLSGAERAERIAWLDLDARGAPMDALELAFDPEATVPGGLVAVYDDGRFAGDARFAGADGGETRILPFALSADVNARVSARSDSLVANARLADGALSITREEVTTTVLELAAAEPVTLVADMGRASNASVAAEASGGVDAAVTTPGRDIARLRAALPAGESRIVLTKTRPFFENYAVTNLSPAFIEEVLAVGGAVDEETRRRLREIAGVIAGIAEIERRIATLEADVEDLREAVAIDRENIEAIDPTTPEGGAVRRRIIERTDAIDAALAEIRELRRQRDAERARLSRG